MGDKGMNRFFLSRSIALACLTLALAPGCKRSAEEGAGRAPSGGAARTAPSPSGSSGPSAAGSNTPNPPAATSAAAAPAPGNTAAQPTQAAPVNLISMGMGTITREWPPSSTDKGNGPNALTHGNTWFSKSGAPGPFVFVFEFAAPAAINAMAFQSYWDANLAPVAAQSVRVEGSTRGPDSGYSAVGDYSLQATTEEQDFPLSHPVTARWLRVTVQPRGGSETSISRVFAFGNLQWPSAAKPLTGVWVFDDAPRPDDRLFAGTGKLADLGDPALVTEQYQMLQVIQHGSDFQAAPCHTQGGVYPMMIGAQAGARITWKPSSARPLHDGVMNAEGTLIVGANADDQDPYVLMRLPAGPDCTHQQNPIGASGQNVLMLTDEGTVDSTDTADYLGGFPGFRFTPLALSVFTSEALSGVDTVMLAYLCDLGKKIAPWQSQALLDFTAAGHKLIINDADTCTSTDYSFLPYQFRTSNPGGHGAGSDNLILVEPNMLGTDIKESAQFLDVEMWRKDSSNQLGDANTVTTKDPHWCGHLFGTNVLNVNGFMHMYAPFGQGLIIYNGFDGDDRHEPTYHKLMTLELQQPVPGLLPCTESVAAKFLIAPSKAVPFAPGRASQVKVPLMVLANQGYAGTVSLAPKAPADAPWKTALSVGQVTLKGDTAPVNLTIDVPASAAQGGYVFLVTGDDGQGNTASARITFFASASAEAAKVQTVETGCTRNLIVGADALFAFNEGTLTSAAQKTLAALGPEIKKAGQHPVQVLGYTDSIGSDRYNQLLSEQRARSVRDWLAARHYLAAGAPIQGMGKQNPVAPNTNPDGSDNPVGRAKNRRVEVAIDTCK